MKQITRSIVEVVAEARLHATDKGYADCSVVLGADDGRVVGTWLNAPSVVADVERLTHEGATPLGTCGVVKHSATEFTLQVTPFREHDGDENAMKLLRRYAQSLIPKKETSSRPKWHR
jgi:hypothetical protein